MISQPARFDTISKMRQPRADRLAGLFAPATVVLFAGLGAEVARLSFERDTGWAAAYSKGYDVGMFDGIAAAAPDVEELA